MRMFWGALFSLVCTVINGTVLIAAPGFGSWVPTVVYTLWWVDVAMTIPFQVCHPLPVFRLGLKECGNHDCCVAAAHCPLCGGRGPQQALWLAFCRPQQPSACL